MLSRKEFDVLTLLESEGELPQRRISEKLNMSLGTVNKTIRDLSEKAFVFEGGITAYGIEALTPYRVKRAVFIAAGFGSRLVPITFNTPKPLIRVNGTRIIDTLLDAVREAEIPEVIIVRGYLGEQFEQLLHKYHNIKFYDNKDYNVSNNIYSTLLVKEHLQNAYVFEADLILHNSSLIRKYEYESNFLGVPVKRTDDWCFTVNKKKIIQEIKLGGEECYQAIGISYWNEEDGKKLSSDIEDIYKTPGGKERFWEQVPLNYRSENYNVRLRECGKNDVIEIDTYQDLQNEDLLYKNCMG